MGADFVQLSLTPLLIGVLAAVACALPGNFLILRRQALIGDAISHVVLPGIVVAFLLTGAISTWPMMFGAAGAAVVAVILIETIKRLGRIEPGAAMGVAFTSLFAAGVLLLEQSDTSSVHLDVQHALYGNLESLIWLAADDWGALLDAQVLAELPPELPRMAAVAALIALLTLVFWRPLKLSTFDEGFAGTIGIPTALLSFALVVVAAVAAVRGLRCGGLDHRHRHVHLPAGRGPADDRPAGDAGAVERGLRGAVGGGRLRAGRLRAALAGLRQRGQRRRHDRHRLRRHSGMRLPVRAAPRAPRRAARRLTSRLPGFEIFAARKLDSKSHEF